MLFLTKLSKRMSLCRGAPPKQILCVQRLKTRLGELATALGRVDLHARQLIEPLNRQDHRLAVPVGRQQVTGAVIFTLALDIDAVSPTAGAGGQE